MISWALAAGFYVYASDGGEPERPLFVIQDMESFLNIGVIFVGGMIPIPTHTA